jgi:hypothetical protein
MRWTCTRQSNLPAPCKGEFVVPVLATEQGLFDFPKTFSNRLDLCFLECFLFRTSHSVPFKEPLSFQNSSMCAVEAAKTPAWWTQNVPFASLIFSIRACQGDDLRGR